MVENAPAHEARAGFSGNQAMTTQLRQWWTGLQDEESITIEPIPFPSRRRRMKVMPPHTSDVESENQSAAGNAHAALTMLERSCRRMDVLARELDCLWYYDDESAPESTDPSSAA